MRRFNRQFTMGNVTNLQAKAPTEVKVDEDDRGSAEIPIRTNKKKIEVGDSPRRRKSKRINDLKIEELKN